jgi:prepilin signal peptidase PulO-like enzyme (type II secretory pathway)
MMNLLIIYAGLFGLVIGSFLNALIWRLHSGESMLDRSRCPKCHEVIVWYDNIPVLSYLLLRGKCRKCGVKISVQYPLVELVTAVLFMLALNHESRVMIQDAEFMILDSKFLALLIKDWFIIAVMVVVFIYDLRWYTILDKVTYSASLFLLPFWFLEAYFNGYGFSYQNNYWKGMAISIAIGIGFFGIQYVISRGRWIGGGDVKLGLVMALALGVHNLLGAIFMAYILGSIIGITLVAFGKKELGSKLPFGTFLSVSTVVMLLWGEQVLTWYTKLLGF